MDDKRQAILDRIVRCRLLAERTTDPQMLDGIKRLIEELEAELEILPPDR